MSSPAWLRGQVRPYSHQVAPAPSRSTVELPRALVLGLGGALLAALLAVAFLLGRLSHGTPPVAAAPAVSLPPQGGSATTPEALPPGVVTTAPEAPAPAGAPGTLPEEWRALGTSPAATGGATATASEREAVAAYFGQVERLETSFRSWSDPQQLAMQLVQQGAQGDRRGLDELLATARQARQAMAEVSPPGPCREHHAESLALMDAAVDLLGRLGPALAGQDFNALQAVASAGQDLEARTTRLQTLDADLRQRYGLPAAAR